MANATPSRLGQDNAAGSVDALFLKKFAGEVLSAFREKTVMRDKHIIRSITEGKTAQFPATWRATASYHTPGEEITGQTIKSTEKTIAVDDLLLSDAFIAKIDELKTHYDYRQEYSFQLGEALAKKYDEQVLMVGLQAARASENFTGDSPSGTQIADAGTDPKTVAADLEGDIFKAAQTMDENDVPESDRWCVLRPAQYYLLVKDGDDIINKDFDGAGSLSKGVIHALAGLPIIKSNNLPITDLSGTTVTGENNTYYDDYSTTTALIWHRSAMGTVQLLDVAFETEWDIRRQGWLMVAKNAVGHGVLRPEAAIEIQDVA